jgi:hypothetical protein
MQVKTKKSRRPRKSRGPTGGLRGETVKVGHNRIQQSGETPSWCSAIHLRYAARPAVGRLIVKIIYHQMVRLVELRGIEPLTSAVRLQRSPI